MIWALSRFTFGSARLSIVAFHNIIGLLGRYLRQVCLERTSCDWLKLLSLFPPPPSLSRSLSLCLSAYARPVRALDHHSQWMG